MADLLTEFLQEWAAMPFGYGDADCGLRLADWFWRVRGFDPVPELRGTYNTAEGCAEVVRNRIGSLPWPIIVSRIARCYGLPRVTDAQPGDIAIIVATHGPTGAIRTRLGWATPKKPAGFRCFQKDQRALAIWRVTNA